MMKKNTIADSKYYSVITHSLRNLWPVLFLIAIFCLAVSVRLDSLPRWIEEPDRAFYGGEPLLPSVDGYYYLSLSQDLLDGTYEPVNKMRGVPDSPLRPSPAPLLSWMGYVLAKYSGLSLNWVAMLLPALLGSLIVFPMYGYGKKFNGPFMGVSSALFAALAGSYVFRTGVGAFDTDCLIISLVLVIGLCFWNFATSEKLMGRACYFVAALLATMVLYFWWEQTPDVVVAVSATYLGVCLLFLYRPSFKEGCLFYGILVGLLLLPPFFQGFGVYAEIYGKVYSIFTYIAMDGTALYPNIGSVIGEQQAFAFEKIIEDTTVTGHVFILALCGILGLLIKRKKDVVILLLFVVVGMLGVFYAARFLIFLIPVLALGLGFFLSEFWLSSRRLYRFIGVMLFLLLALVYHFYATSSRVIWPFNDRNEIHALVQLKNNTPDDAVIWSKWSKGYLINYWARRATISDGSIHSGQLSHHLYWPLAHENQKFAANFIKFFSVRGQQGITYLRKRTGLNETDTLAILESILSEKPGDARMLCDELLVSVGNYKEQEVNDWFTFFFPVLQRPVYLFLHQRMLFASSWYWFGTWDVDKGEGVHAHYALYPHVMFGDDNSMYTMWMKHLDLQTGIFSGRQLAEVYDVNNQEVIRKRFDEGENIIYVERNLKAAVLMEEDLWDSVFNRLFIRSNADSQHFTPFYIDGFNAQIWQVR